MSQFIKSYTKAAFPEKKAAFSGPLARAVAILMYALFNLKL
jgi:hypothetical protein